MPDWAIIFLLAVMVFIVFLVIRALFRVGDRRLFPDGGEDRS